MQLDEDVVQLSLSSSSTTLEQAAGTDAGDGGYSSSKGTDAGDGGGNSSSKRSKTDSGTRSVSQSSAINSRKDEPLQPRLKALIMSQIKGPFIGVEEGLLTLLKQALLSERITFAYAASLAGHVDHYQSVDDEDLGWGCGWRNIQILCSFLLAEVPEARDVLFNGAGFVPDIPALQRWLEIAWTQGFDEAGAEYFNWEIHLTRKWIGTTECAALLRSFGIRARIVSFTSLGGERERILHSQFPGTAMVHDEGATDIQKGGETETGGWAVKCDECGLVSRYGSKYRGIVNKDCGLCDNCMDEGHSGIVPHQARIIGNESSAEPSDVLCTTDKDFDCDGPIRGTRLHCLSKRICAACMHEQDKAAPLLEHIVVPASRGSGPPPRVNQGSTEDNAVVHTGPQDRESDKKDILERRSGHLQLDRTVEKISAAQSSEQESLEEKAARQGIANLGLGKSGNQKECEKKIGGFVDRKENRTALGAVDAQHKIEKENVDDLNDEGEKSGDNVVGEEERGKAGMIGDSWQVASPDINHHHLIEWVWRYFTEDSHQSPSSSSYHSREPVYMSKRSPLYFQHRGHSRTIVGIERRRKLSGISEDVFLLLLDPSQSTRRLARALREKKGWQKLVKNDVQTLKESEYQLCYADRGIATGDELEQLKILSSSRYSYYSK